MKFVKLLSSARVAGELRHPHEGVLHVSDDDAQRLFDNQEAEDVSADFSTEQAAAAPVEAVTNGSSEALQGSTPANPHQAEIAPEGASEADQPEASSAPAEDQPKPARRKAAAHKE